MPQCGAWRLLCLIALYLIACTVWAGPGGNNEAQAEAAATAMGAGRFEEAVRIYKSLDAQFPSDALLHLSLATALYSAGHYSDALARLESIRPFEKDYGKFWFLLGMTEAKLGEPAKATDRLTRALELEPGDDHMRLEAASTLLELHQLSAAEKQYLILAAKLPNLPKVWQGLALAQLGLSQGALEKLKTAVPHSSYLFGLAAVAAAQSGNTDKGVELYQKALAAPPQAGWMRLELAALQSGSTPDSCSDTTYACRFSTGDVQKLGREVANLRSPEALYWTTRIYAILARGSMEKLLALPHSPEQHQVMARLYAQSGRKADEIAELREALNLSPDNPLATGDLAEALWSDRMYEEALSLLTKLVQSHLQRSDWQFEMGDALFNLGRPEEAITHLSEAVRLSPQMLPAQAKLGEALLRMGDAATATPHLELALPLDRDGSIHFQLAEAYRKLGYNEAAARALQRQRELAGAPTANLQPAPSKQ